MPIVLGGDPKGKNFLYTNGNSVIIRDINVSQILKWKAEIVWTEELKVEGACLLAAIAWVTILKMGYQ